MNNTISNEDRSFANRAMINSFFAMYDNKEQAKSLALKTTKEERIKENDRQIAALDVVRPSSLGEVVLVDYEGLQIKAPEREDVTKEDVDAAIDDTLNAIAESLKAKGQDISGKITLTDKLANRLNSSCSTAKEYRDFVEKYLIDQEESNYAVKKSDCAFETIQKKSTVIVTDAAVEWVTNVFIKECFVPAYERERNDSVSTMLANLCVTLEEFKVKFYDEMKYLAETIAVAEAIEKKEGFELAEDDRTEFAKKFNMTPDEMIKRYGPNFFEIYAKNDVIANAIIGKITFV